MTGHKALDEIFSEARQWRQGHPWTSRWYGLRYRAANAWAWRRLPRYAWQRATRGYSTRDWWSFDGWICGVIGRACADLRDHGHGHPADTTEAEWNDVLTRISEPLLEYSEHHLEDLSYQREMARYEAAREAMHLFAENLGSMWD